MLPPCISTICLAMAKPSPVPPFARVLEPSNLVEFLEDALLLLEWNASPVSRTKMRN
jgi:hypothetical protein